MIDQAIISSNVLAKAGSTPWLRLFKSIPNGLLILLALLIASCNKATPTPSSAVPTVPAGAGVIHGIVKFIGHKPPTQIIGGNCCPGSTPVQGESLIINENNTLKNIVLYIKDAPRVSIVPPQDQVLAQINCQYVPHVLAIMTGQNLVITSHDPTLHNIHIEADANPSQNFSQMQGSSHWVNFALPELVKFKCDVHPWMTAYAYIFDHPFFAVTGDGGQFEIDHLPTGTYTLVAWQEKLERQEMQVTIINDKPVEVHFEFHGP